VEVRPAFPKKRVTGAGTQGHGITTQSKYADPCWELTKYFVTPAAQRILAANYSVVPVLVSMRSDPGWRGLPPPPSNNDAFVQAADAGTLPPELPVECGSVYTGDVQKTMDEAITKILRGELNAASALKAAAAHIDACMAGSPQSR
jgi:maltose-binding protein MalE